MKFFPTYPTDYEHRTIRDWLVVFICGFLTICILGPVLCLGLWLIGEGAAVIQLSSLQAIFAVSVPEAARVIFQVATVFGALLALLASWESARRRRQKIHVPGEHPTIGHFEQLPYFETWQAKPRLPTGLAVILNGPGRSPSNAQAALWRKFIARFDELNATAAQSLLTETHPLRECAAVTFTPTGITLTPDGGLHVRFEFATEPEDFSMPETEEACPTASFTSSLELKSTEWLRPYE